MEDRDPDLVGEVVRVAGSPPRAAGGTRGSGSGSGPSRRPTPSGARPRTGRRASRRPRGSFSRRCSGDGSSAMTIATSSSAARNGCGMPAIARSTSRSNRSWRGTRGRAPRTGAASALRHRARILAAMTATPDRRPTAGRRSTRGRPTPRPRRPPIPTPSPRASSSSPTATCGSTSTTGAAPAGDAPAPRSRRAAPARPAPARMVVGARRPAARGARPPRSSPTCAARACPTRRWTATTWRRSRPTRSPWPRVPGWPGDRADRARGPRVRWRSSRRSRRRASGPVAPALVLVDGGWERLEVDDRRRRRRVPARPRRAARGHALDGRLARRPAGVRSGDLGRGPGAARRRDAVVETAAGHVVRAVRPHVVEAIVRTMFGYDPAPVARRRRGAGDGVDRPRRRARTARASRSCAGAGRRAPRRGGRRSASPATRASATT